MVTRILSLALGICLSSALAAPPPDLRALFAETRAQFLRAGGDAAARKRAQESFVRELSGRAKDDALRAEATPLLGKASRAAMTDVMKALLAGGANAAQPYRGHTPLWWAIRSGSPDAVAVLLDAGVDASQSETDPMSETRTPAIVFAAEVSTATVGALLDHGAKADAAVQGGPWSGETALFQAARKGDARLVTLLLDHGADPNRRVPDSGHMPLMAGAGYPAVARILIEHGAALNATDNYGRSAIIFAALSGCPEAVAFLRERGGRPDVADKNGKTANDYLSGFSKDGVPTGVCSPKP